MGDEMTFKEVSEINRSRCLEWHPNGIDDWSPTDWACAMAGEAGEVCNAIKKLRRLQDDIPDSREKMPEEHIRAIAMEIGDTFLYLDLLAQRLGINMEEAVRDTFNRVSDREGLTHKL